MADNSPKESKDLPPLKGGVMYWLLWTRKFTFGTASALLATTII
jgi:hypothetical protein